MKYTLYQQSIDFNVDRQIKVLLGTLVVGEGLA